MGRSRVESLRWPRGLPFPRLAGTTLATLGEFLAMALLSAPIALLADDSAAIDAQLSSATALHQRADYAHSIPLLKSIVEQSPKNYLANLLLGEDLLRSGSPRDAIVPLQAASELRPDDGAPQAYLAQAGEALGDLAMASEALESAVARSGAEEQYLMAWAGYCLDRFHMLEMALLASKAGEGAELRIEAQGHPEGSAERESLLAQSAAASPEQRGIWGELGVAQLALNKLPEARASLEQARRRDPSGAETTRLQSLIAAKDQDWQTASERLLDLGTRSPSELSLVLGSWPASLLPGPEITGPAWSCLRASKENCPLIAAPPQGGEGLPPQDLFALGRWEQLKALPVPRDDSTAWFWRGVALARTGDCTQAIPALERGLKADPLEAGYLLQSCFASEEARLEEKLSQAGNQAALHQLRGDVALRLRFDAAAAQKEYAEAVRLRPGKPGLQARLAESYKMLGDTVHARQAALAALALNPREASALQTLAQMAMTDRDYAEALARLKQLAVLEPRDPWTQVQLGVAYGQLGKPDEAVSHLVPQLASGYPDPKGALHAQLARALRKLGREDEARQASAEATRLANQALESHDRENPDAH